MTDGVPRSEFLIRGATVVTMDPAIGDLPSGDIHVADGEIVSVAAEIPVGAEVEVLDAAGMIALPGLMVIFPSYFMCPLHVLQFVIDNLRNTLHLIFRAKQTNILHIRRFNCIIIWNMGDNKVPRCSLYRHVHLRTMLTYLFGSKDC